MAEDKAPKKEEKKQYSVIKTGTVISMFPSDAEALIKKGVITDGAASGKKKKTSEV